MYRLLLPVEANVKRHLADETRLPSGFWIRAWAALQGCISGVKSLRR